MMGVKIELLTIERWFHNKPEWSAAPKQTFEFDSEALIKENSEIEGPSLYCLIHFYKSFEMYDYLQ